MPGTPAVTRVTMPPSNDTRHGISTPETDATAGFQQALPWTVAMDPRDQRNGPWELREAIEVVGADAESWLQGQLSQQVRGLAIGKPRFALLLNLQGKIKADLWITRGEAEHFCLWVPYGLASDLLAYFDKYIMMEDVELAFLGAALLELNADAEHVCKLGDGTSAETSSDVPPAKKGEHPFTTAITLRILESEAETGTTCGAPGECASLAWAAAAIACGYARFGVDYPPESALPQEVALAAWGVSFSKGCYQGQEPVVMLEHRGKPPRYLVRLEGVEPTQAEALGSTEANDTASYAPGTPLSAADAGPILGRLGSTSFGNDAPPKALALLKRSAAANELQLIGAGRRWRVSAILTPGAPSSGL